MTASTFPDSVASSSDRTRQRYNLFLLLVAGLGGLLYGIDVGIIGGALPYLEATSKLDPSQLSIIVAAVLLGSVFSTLFAGLLADWMGRKPLMILSGVAFIVSIPVIALSHGYAPLFFGRLLQGMSGGLIGIVVPLYLAECLSASTRGKGTGVFQWLLTFGIVVAALVGIYFSYRVDAVARTRRCRMRSSRSKIMPGAASSGYRCLPACSLSSAAFMVTESPRWLYRRSKPEKARAALLRSRSPEQATIELQEMEDRLKACSRPTGEKVRDSLLRRKYVIPFLLACVILACNTATGINSVIGFNTGHPAAERPLRPPGALGLRPLHRRQLLLHHRRHDAGRSQGPQVPLHSRHQRHHRFHGHRRNHVSAHRKAERRLPQPDSVAGRSRTRN